MDNVFLLQHVYESRCDNMIIEKIKIIGIYSSEKKAKKTIEEYIKKPGFNNYDRDCFEISEYLLDENNWIDGFINTDEVDDNI